MTDHTSLSSDLELLSKDTLIEKDILDFPMFDITSCESPLPQQPLNQTLLEGTITPPNRPNTFVFNGSIKNKKAQYSLKQALEKQKRSCSEILNNQKPQIITSTIPSKRTSTSGELFSGTQKDKNSLLKILLLNVRDYQYPYGPSLLSFGNKME